MRQIIVAAIMVVLGGVAPARAHEAPAGTPDLVLQARGSESRQQCSQFAMNLSADASRVRPLVPELFVFSRDIVGKAVLGYRMFECRGARIGSGPARRVVWSELGVRVLPPEGLPEVHVDQHVDGHDYYMLAFRTNSLPFARALRGLGLRLPGQPRLFSRDLTYDVERGRAAPEIGVPEVQDVLRPVELSGSEPGYATSLSSLAGLYYRKSPSPLDVREWFIRPDCQLVSVLEHKERPTAVIPDIDLVIDPGTLVADLVDVAPGGDGRRRVRSSTDVFVQFDEVMTWNVRPAPVPLVPAAYELVRGSAAEGGSGCRMSSGGSR